MRRAWFVLDVWGVTRNVASVVGALWQHLLKDSRKAAWSVRLPNQCNYFFIFLFLLSLAEAMTADPHAILPPSGVVCHCSLIRAPPIILSMAAKHAWNVEASLLDQLTQRLQTLNLPSSRPTWDQRAVGIDGGRMWGVGVVHYSRSLMLVPLFIFFPLIKTGDPVTQSCCILNGCGWMKYLRGKVF